MVVKSGMMKIIRYGPYVKSENYEIRKLGGKVKVVW